MTYQMATNYPSSTEQAGQATHLAPPYSHGTGRIMRSSNTASPSRGSATQTITSSDNSRSISPENLVLRLRGSHEPTPELEERGNSPSTGNSRRRRIQWAEDVVDNEGLGRKKSKVCCIFHKNRDFGESSSDESSSSSSDSDSDRGGSSSGADDGSARLAGGNKRGQKGRRGRKHNHNHEDGDVCDHDHGSGGARRRPSPNAYEKMPKYDVKPLNGNVPGQSGFKS